MKLFKYSILFSILLVAFFCSSLMANEQSSYFFPYVNAYEATVMETPESMQFKVPEQIPVEEFRVYPFPDRAIPDLFWFEGGLNCSLSAQERPAPLIFILAGTGARYNSPKMSYLQKVFYQAGFHVLSITSPTYSEFIITASSSMMPGFLEEDAKDVYRVMQLAWEEVGDDIDVTEFFLTGYSLGGSLAAIVSKLDKDVKTFDFKKVLLINPAMSLYASAGRLDTMLLANVPGGIEKFGDFVDDSLAKFAEVGKEMGYVDLSGEYLYEIYRKYPPREDFLASLIGFAFRFDSSSMIFTADVMNGGGYVVPKGAELSYSTSLTPYSMVLFRTGFIDYFNEYFLPYWQQRKAGLTREECIRQLSLARLSSYLQQSKEIGLLHNEDDIILAPGEIEQFQEIFGDRARIYPTGGHCGNINHPDVVRFMTQFFTGEGE